MDIFVILIISVPIFYIWGLISFINLFTKGKLTADVSEESLPDNRQSYLKKAIDDLKKQVQSHPDKKLTQLLSEYESELASIMANPDAVFTQTAAPAMHVDQQKPKVSSPTLQNWYKDNSINLLLYIGAFLIVISATIYVGLDQVSGVSKAILLSALTLLFFASGLWFARQPKIKNAGAAFAGIGALLIPIAGFGWYNFVFQYTTISLGTVWFGTSVIGLFAYFSLARYFKSVFYAYITTFSTLSFTFALVNMQGLQSNYYILASTMTSIVLLVIYIYFKNYTAPSWALFSQPFGATANIALPLSLVYGLVLFTSDDTMMLTTINLFLGCIFYVLSYITFKKSLYVLPIELLFSLGLYYFGIWQHFDTINNLVIASIVVFLCIFLTKISHDNDKTEETKISTTYALSLAVTLFILAQAAQVTSMQLLYFEFVPLAAGTLLALITRNVYLLTAPIIFIGMLLYTFANDILKYSDQSYVLGFLYTTLASLFYMLAVMYKTHKRALPLLAIASCMYFFLSTFLIADKWDLQICNFLALTIISFSSAYRFAQKDFIYLGNFFISASLFCVLRQFSVLEQYYPLAYMSLSIAYFLFSRVCPPQLQERYNNSALVGSLLNSIFFGLYSISMDTPYANGLQYHLEQEYALVAAYFSTLLFAFVSYEKKSSQLGYFTSGMAMTMYIWQIHFLGATEVLYYTLPTGAYFFVLAYLQRRKQNLSLKHLFDYVALFFLIYPTWTLSFGDGGMMYAAILGIIGLGLLVYSITYNEKLFRYASILAIVLAVTSQSRWAIIGLAGVGFLGLALYLLIFRKEDEQPKHT